MEQPTVVIRIGESYIARDDHGEILETVDLDDAGQPDWNNACVCDSRGMGGEDGYRLLLEAVDAAERNAAMTEETLRPVVCA